MIPASNSRNNGPVVPPPLSSLASLTSSRPLRVLSPGAISASFDVRLTVMFGLPTDTALTSTLIVELDCAANLEAWQVTLCASTEHVPSDQLAPSVPNNEPSHLPGRVYSG